MAGRKRPHRWWIAGGILLGALGGELLLRMLPPRSVWSRSTHVKNLEFEYDLSLNSDYFRDEDFKKKKPADTQRIFLIGDSFVFGAGVAQDQTLDRLLEEKLNGLRDANHYEVFNLGKPGANPRGYLEVAKQFAGYGPDLIILSLYVDNDIQTSSLKSSSKLLTFLSKLPQKLQVFLWRNGWSDCFFPEIKKQVQDPNFQREACAGRINPYHFTERIPLGENHDYYRKLEKTFREDPSTKRDILAIRDLFRQIPFLLLLHPSEMQVSPLYVRELKKLGFSFADEGVVGNEIQVAIAEWAKSEGIDYLDLLEVMKGEPANLFHPFDRHYTASGNAVVAEAIRKKLAEREWIFSSAEENPKK